MKTHPWIERIPEYLQPYIAEQDASLYTPIDHATWRFILKVSKAFYAKHAHQKYLDGLKETGISSDKIPLIEEMNHCLSQFHWQAVPVTGFIPPAVFMEFLSLGILPIACDMRTLDHIAYTPAPDIVHEAAGHAPIVADPEYASYLRSYGEISQKAIFSHEDMDVYHAIRHLSEVKEDPESTDEAIQAAQERLNQAIASVSYVSEATLLARMGWWTFEYGLVGSLDSPKIYGAGLLSSIGESYHCLGPGVKKVPFSIDCIETTYDITRPQPQLFVTPDFQALKNALKELAERMAFRRGGVEGLEKARLARTVTTTVLDTGVQMSGQFSGFLKDDTGRPCYLQFQGPTQISYQDEELEGQGANYHREGFGTPLEAVSESLLKEAQLEVGRRGHLQFRSGVRVEGKLVGLVKRNEALILLSFQDCSVTRGSEVLFRPEWGTYDMICGEKIVSVFGGAADRKKYLAVTGEFNQKPRKQKTNLTAANRGLNILYAQVRSLRDQAKWTPENRASLMQIFEELEKRYPNDWLLRYELLEISLENLLRFPWEDLLRQRLLEIAGTLPDKKETILRGLSLLPE